MTVWNVPVCDCGHDERQHNNHRSLSPFMNKPCSVADCDCPDFRAVGEGEDHDGGRAA